MGSRSDQDRSKIDTNSLSNRSTSSTLKTIRQEHDQVHRSESRKDNISIVCVLICCILIGLLVTALVLDRQKSSKPSRKIIRPIQVDLFNDSKEEQTPKHQEPSEEEISLVDMMVANLTSHCVAKYGPCFYHKNFYAKSCSKTDCNSVMTVIQSNDLWFWQSDSKPIKTPDHALCDNGKWCAGQKCVPFPSTKSSTPKIPKKPKPHGGGMRLDCDEKKACVESFFQSTNLSGFVKCSTKSVKDQCSSDDEFSGFFSGSVQQNKLRVKFVSCNNPLPVNSEPTCFNAVPYNSSDAIAFSPLRAPYILYEICALCSNETDVTQCTSRTTGDTFGKRCRNSDKTPTFCIGHGNCVPSWKSAPDAYNLGAAGTCKD